MLEKTVTLYFMDDGDLNGRIECTVGNWEGVIYKIPRTKKGLCNEDDTCGRRLRQCGLYILFGETKSDGTKPKKTVYVGKADSKDIGEGVWKRAANGKHRENANIDKGWTEAVILVQAKPDSFLGGAGLSYLENKFYWIADAANDAGCYDMLNGNEPNSARRSIREGDRNEADDFAEHVKTVMRILGYGDLFNASDEDVDKRNKNMFRMKYKGHKARMEKRDDGKFELQKGSWISPEISDDLPNYLKDLHEKLRKESKIEGDILVEPITLDNPGATAEFVCGKIANGYGLWKNFDGEMLKQAGEE